jgi:hypothetical protein
MIKLVIDSQEKRIVIVNTEVDESELANLGMVSLENCDLWAGFPDAPRTRVDKVELTELDFEGFVLHLIDHNGFSFMTEIPGLA